MNSIYNTVISHCIHCRRQNNVASTSRRKKCPNMQIFANLLHRYKTPKLKYMHSRKEATYHQVIGNFLVGWKKDRLFTFFDFDIGLFFYWLMVLPLHYMQIMFIQAYKMWHMRKDWHVKICWQVNQKNRWIRFIRKIRYMAANVLSAVASPYVCTGSSHTEAWSELNIVRDI